ncbi:hypothetical protein E1091_00150 [Micromonospora fluostatini]|uniref:Uncharacterized protein n=1 Tax=Micromonospora fluostatini TaxID=1629071 RepID=A0ABY2DM61_9ACTN|nr:hypothetical protein E1091_00150 [Micromonospora fluostatini]
MNPIEGAHGKLIMGGWIGETPQGQEEVFLLLTTPSPTAGESMTAIASGLGLRPATDPRDPVEVPVEAAGVAIRDDGWLRLHIGNDHAERPVHVEMIDMARARRRVVLVVGTKPMPPGVAEDAYIDAHGGAAWLGLVSVTPHD